MDTYINMENNFIKMEYMFTIDLLDLIIDVSSFFSSFARTFYTFNYNFYLPQLEMIYYNHYD
jgi:hypothetical protein